MNPAKRMSDAERVELMLCVLPWIAARGTTTFAEIAEHFGADAEQLRRDINRVFVDVDPGDQGNMVDVFTEEDSDVVEVRLPGSFEDPPNLDHAEALHLLAAGTAMAAVQGASDTLEPALDKLASVLGEGARSAIRVDLGSGDPQLRELLRNATRERRRVGLRYFSWGSDTVGDRTVDPYSLRSIKGEWYLTGYCHDRDALRHFRLDRVLAAEEMGEPGAFEVPQDVPAPVADFGAGAREVELRIPFHASWVVDSLPVVNWTEDGDSEWITLRIRVGNDAWLERILLRLPPEAEATDAGSGEDLTGQRAQAARRILRRHEEHGSDSGVVGER